MPKEYKTLSLIWREVAITVRYCDDWSRGHYQIHGSKMTHTEIIRDDGKQLPITDSGYRSHFMDITHLDKYNGILDYVTRWLDHQAQSKKWKAYVADQGQLKLF